MNDTTTIERKTEAQAPASGSREIEVVTKDGEVVSGLPAGYEPVNQSLAVSLARAEVDQQIATARALPRSITRAVQNITTLATLDDESAEECIYALPRAGKAIKGPSVRLAEIIASQWGNCRVGTRVVHVDRVEKYVEAEGVFHDLETNMAITARIRRRISDKKGRLLQEDMIVVTGNAAAAIAKRNAILGGVPKAVWRKAYAAVEQVLAGDIKTLAERREKAMKAFAAFGAMPEQVLGALGVAGLDDINLEHMTTLTGMHAALKSGEATLEEMFPKPAPAAEKPKNLNDALDQLAKGPEPESNTDIKSGTEGSPSAAPETTAGEAAPPTAQQKPASPAAPRLTEADKKLLKRYAEALANMMSDKKLQAASEAFLNDHPMEEGTPIFGAASTIFEAHRTRVAGDGSPADADAVLKKVLA